MNILKPVLITVFTCVCMTNLSFAADQPIDRSAETASKGTKAQLIEGATPIYPESARKRGIEGWVKLQFVVNPDGTTADIEVIDTSIEGYFEKAAGRSLLPGYAEGEALRNAG